MTATNRISASRCAQALSRVCVLAACLYAGSLQAQAGTLYRFSPPAAWVDVATFSGQRSDPAAADPNASVSVLLFDRQINVTATGDEYYQHVAARVLNATGIADYSQLDFVVDPTFQTLDIHALRVVRDGRVVDQRETARITELAQETDLSNRVYNGRYSVNVLLSDVRAGDVVEYAYTLSSREALFPGHFYTRLDLGWSQPVEVQRVRVRSPLGRALRYRTSDGSPVPPATVRNGANEVAILSRNVAAVPADTQVPGWYSSWPFLEVSDLEDWGDAVRLVAPLFQKRHEGGGVDDVVRAIRAAGGSPEQQALRALRYVQEEIRYTSISIGRGSHEPTDPNTILERRFGDCKDKSLLLATLLNELGIKADVALVHSWWGRALDDTLPSPYAFDHAIVRAELGGEPYWLDATAATQYGALDRGRPANFERALVLRAGARSLETIPLPAVGTSERRVLVTLDARRGIEAPATLELVTQYRGGFADNIRSTFAGGNAEQRQADFTRYIARYYPSAKPVATYKLSDDRDENVVELREQYELDSAFTRNDEGVLELVLHADELYSYADALGAASRRSPLALQYPVSIKQRIVAHLPESWPVETGTFTVDNPAFRYRSDVGYAANTLTLSYEYDALADHVAPADIARYEADRARMYDDLGYLLTYNPELEGALPAAVAPLPMAVLLLVLVGSVWGAVTLGYRYDPEPAVAPADAPKGIAGWLLLPTLSVIATPFVLAWAGLQWLPFIGAEQWRVLPTLVNDGYRGWAQLSVLLTISGCAVLTVASTLAAWLFFTKRSSAPKFFIATSWGGIAFGIAVIAWAAVSGLNDETVTPRFVGETLREILVTVLWTAYMLQSRRVKNTFVKRLRRPKAQPAIAAAG